MKNIFIKKISSAVTAAAIAAGSFAAISLPVMAFDAPAPDTGAANGISNGGEWSIYNSKVGFNRTGTIGTTIQDKSNDGTVEITGNSAISAAFQFDLSTKTNNDAAKDKVIKSAKLRLTPMVSKSGTKQAVYKINNTFNTTEGKTPIAEFTIPGGTGDDFFSDSNITSLTAVGMSEYPSALANWQTAIDMTGEVVAEDRTLSLLVEYSSGNVNKTEYATSNVAGNGRLNSSRVPLLYNGGLTDYSKWVYPQIVFEYSDEENYKNAYADFIKANSELSAGKVTETEKIALSAAENGSTITLEMYGNAAQPIKIDGSSVVLNDEYTGNDEYSYVKLIVSNNGAEYTRIVSVPADYTRSNTISFDAAKNAKGEISITSNGKAYTDGTAYAKQGGTFTVNDGANAGYKANVAVTTDTENPQTISKNADGTYTMPDSDVNVSVSYVKKRAYGTTRIAAANSISIKSNGDKQGNSSGASGLVIGAGRITFIKFDLSGYNSDAISDAQISFTAWNTANTKAVFYVPNNNWDESTISKDFKLDGTDSTKLSSFAYSDGTISLLNGTNIGTLIVPNGDDASTAANGILKDYYIGSTGTNKTANFSVTEGIKTALSKSSDKVITLMIYSTGGGNDASSVMFAGSLSDRPSLTITETAANLSDGDLITEINNLQDLESFAEIVSGGKDYAGRTVTLNADIDLSEKYNADGESWAPIGIYDSAVGTQAFEGTFNGNNHTISGLYINEQSIAQGLFGAVSGTIKDLTVKGTINGSSVIGGIAGRSSGDIKNCTSEVKIIARREAGGIVGTLSNGGTISNCKNRGSIEIKDKETYAGGIAAHNIGGVIRNCSNTGSIVNGSNGFRNRIGGIVGYLDNGEVSLSYNNGGVASEAETSSYVADTTQNYSGGIAGYNNHGVIMNCYNTGDVSNAVDYAGGIAGYLSSGSVQSCYSTGNITGSDHVGGVIGFNLTGTAINCYYLDGTAECGMNGADLTGSAEAQTAAEFASGEAAYHMQGEQPEQVWGQRIVGDNTDSYPVFTADSEKRVYKVTFGIADAENEGQYKEYTARYTNAGGKVGLPENPDMTAFEHWSTIAENNSDSCKFTADTVVNGDITVYAIGEITIPLSTDTAIWAQDIIDRGTVTRGTDGNNSADNIGKINDTVTDEQLVILGLFLDGDAVKGKAIGSKVRLNSLDASTNAADAAKWNGYIEDTISTSKAGTYDIYLIGTGAADRNFAITVNDDKTVTTTSATNLTERVAAHLYSAQIELNEGTNKLHIQAPSGKSAPNFIAMYVTKHPDGATRILPDSGEGEIKDAVGFTHSFDGNASSVVWHVSNGINTAEIAGDIPVITNAGETVIGLIITDIPDTIADSITATVVVR